ncbi:MAG: iron-sulfur cluster repair di-iron protein [Bacteroidota bacterium]
MENINEAPIGQLVVSDYRTAAIFKKYGIDFCCNGNRSIDATCAGNTDQADALKEEIRHILEMPTHGKEEGTDYSSWPLDLLADYIEKKHHRYVAEQIPVVTEYLEKLCRVHGYKHPELFEIRSLFSHCAEELSAHMKKEELMLFPFIRKMVAAKKGAGTTFSAPFNTVQNPIQVMMKEHQVEGERFSKIRSLSDEYTPPADGCNTYKVGYALLEEFENDLHLHIHLENNILFPKAIAMEGVFAC